MKIRKNERKWWLKNWSICWCSWRVCEFFMVVKNVKTMQIKRVIENKINSKAVKCMKTTFDNASKIMVILSIWGNGSYSSTEPIFIFVTEYLILIKLIIGLKEFYDLLFVTVFYSVISFISKGKFVLKSWR